MIQGFEQETAPLNDIEKDAAHVIALCMMNDHQGMEKAVTAQQIAMGMAMYGARYRTDKGKPYLNGARIRKIINHIRMTKCPNLIASSKGYYISTDKDEVLEYIVSLRARANAIQAVADRMQEGIE